MISNLKNRKGFSLMELIVAISIIGIMSIVATPYTLSWRQTAKVNTVMNVVMRDMLEAKSQAIKNNCDLIVTFDLVENIYRFYLDTNGAGVDISNLIKSVSISSIDSYVDFGNIVGVDLEGGECTLGVVMGSTSDPIRVIFKPNGITKNFGTIYLTPGENATEERQRAIDISSTGRVSRWAFKSGVWEELIYE